MAVLNEAGLAPLPVPAPPQHAQQERQAPAPAPGAAGAAAPAAPPVQQGQQPAAAPAVQQAAGDALSDLAAALADLDGSEEVEEVDQAPLLAPQQQQLPRQAWSSHSLGPTGGEGAAAAAGWEGNGASLAPDVFDGMAPAGSSPLAGAADWGAAADSWGAGSWGAAADGWGAGRAASAAASAGGGGLLDRVAADIAALSSRNVALQHEIDSISIASSSGLHPWSAVPAAAVPDPQQQHPQQQEQVPPPRLHVATSKVAPGSSTAAALLPRTPELSQS